MTTFTSFVFLLFGADFTLITCYTLLFEDLTHLPYFVDKTLMLRILFDEGFIPDSGNPYYFISCPRYFGKTANLRMIQSFAKFQYNEYGRRINYKDAEVYKIYSRMKISDYQYIITEHMSRYPVIYLDLKTIGHLANDSQHIANDLTAIFAECLYDHPQLYNLSRTDYTSRASSLCRFNESDITLLKTLQHEYDNMSLDHVPNILLQLCRLLYEFHDRAKVVLLVDNYDDTALHSFARAGSKAEPVYSMINTMLSLALDKGRGYIKTAVITGVSSLGYVIGDSLRKLVTHYPFLDDHQFTPYFGLLHNELLAILSRAKYEQDHREAIVDYYKGYVTFPRQTIIYNPYSIGNHFFHSTFNQTSPYPLRSYWTEFEIVGKQEVFAKCQLTRQLLKNGTVRFPLKKIHSSDALEQLENMRDRNFDNITTSEQNILMTLYFEIGYLSHTSEPDCYAIPNKELKGEEVVNSMKPMSQQPIILLNTSTSTYPTASTKP